MKPSMQDYIMRQPEIWKEAIGNRKEPQSFPLPDKIIWIGSGTSFHVAQVGAWLAEHLLDVDSEAVLPIPFSQRKVRDAGVLVIGVSQSGTSASTCEAMEHAKAAGCQTVCYSQDRESTMGRLCDRFWQMPGEKELVPPETQGYTSALVELVLAMAPEKEEELLSLVDCVSSQIPRMQAWVNWHLKELEQAKKIYMCGDGIDHVTAQEGALKVGETIQTVTKAMEQEELAHFADMAFDKEEYLFLMESPDRLKRSHQVENLAKSITDHVFVFSTSGREGDRVYRFPFEMPDWFRPIAMVIPFQILSDTLSRKQGKDTAVFPHPEVVSIAHDDSYELYKH